jgi:8-oxo-dGTP diphosphatase
MPDKKHLTVAAGLILQADGRLLLGQRPPDKPWPGWWELPGGKLEPGESPQAALVRELREEIGIEVRQATPWFVMEHEYPSTRVTLHFWRVTAWWGSPMGQEGQALRWVKVRQATHSEIEAAKRRAAELAGQHPEGVYPLSPEEAIGLHLETADDQPSAPVGALLPAAMPPLRYLRLPKRLALTRITDLGWPAFRAALEMALACGLDGVQLREPGWPRGVDDPKLLDLFQQVSAMCQAQGAQTLLSSVHPLGWARHTDGLHLRSSDLLRLSRVARPRLAAPGPWLGASVHNEQELALARQLNTDYVAISPVKLTPSHPGAPALGWSAFETLAMAAGRPCYALGGVGPDDEVEAHRHGAHGVASLRAWWQAA